MIVLSESPRGSATTTSATTGASRTGERRSSQSFRILTVKLGSCTASAHRASHRPVLDAQKIRARAQCDSPVGKSQFR
eukprot:COSAG02_NODE_32_length_50374_cov_46.674013_4_plen_78_part_00